MSGIVTKQEYLRVLKELATPIDYQDLITKEILKKSGAWYVVLKPAELPKYAWRHAVEMATGPNGKLKLKFKKSTKRAQTIYKRMTGESISD